MAKDNESTMKFKVDISQLKAAMQDAKRSISLANAEFKNATAGIGKWSNSITGVEAKIKQLNKTSDAQRTVLANLKEQYALVSAEMGEDSTEAQRLKIQIENQEAAIKRTDAQLDTYSSSLADLKAEQKAAQSPMGQLNSAIKQQEQAVESLKKEYANAVLEYGKNSKEAKSLEQQINSLSSELAENKNKLSDAEKAADKLDKSLEEVDDSANDAGGGIGALTVALGNLIADGIARAIDFIGNLVDDAVAAADALQKFESTMGFAGYDSSAIKQARKDVQDYADSTVYDLDTIANTTAQLAANGIDDYTGLTEAAGNLNAVAGGNAESFKSLSMMLTQTAGAGKLTTENWNQLADAIPGASGVLQQALLDNGAYTGDFREAMAKGEITAEEFNEALMQLGSDPVAVEAATSVSTFEGAMGNLEATVVNGLLDIYEQIGSENITGFINGISEAIEAVIPYIKEAVQWVLDNKDAIIAALAGIAAGIVTISAIQGIMAMVTAFQTFFAIVKSGQGIVAAFNVVMGMNPFVLIAAAVVGLITALVVLFNTNEDFRNKIIEIWESIKAFVGGAIDAIALFFTETIPNAINSMVEWFAGLPDRIAEFIGMVAANIAIWATDVAERARTAGVNFLNNIANFFRQLPGKVWGFLSSTISKVASFVSNMASKAREAGSRFLSNIVSTLQQIPGKVVSIGGNIVKGIWNGISNGLGWIKGKIEGWVGNVTNFLKNLFGIASPSKLMRDEIGKWLPPGIAAGFDAQLPSAMKDIQSNLDAAIGSLKADVSVAAGNLNGSVSNVTGDGVGNQNQQVINFYQTNNSPKPMNRLDVYRDTKSLLFTAKVGLMNV